MKKIFALVLALATILTFAACSSEKCDICGKDGADNKVEVLGQKMYYCDDCKSGNISID